MAKNWIGLFYYLNEYYVDSTNNDQLSEVALQAIVEQLDPYSRYQSKEELEEQAKRDKGQKNRNIGVTVFEVKDSIVITHVTKGGPADKAGIQRGDLILAVDHQPVVGVDISTVSRLFEGKDSTFIELTIKRNSLAWNLSVLRGVIPIKTVAAAYLIQESIGYLKITGFNKQTAEDFRFELGKLKSKGVTQLILDLRGNNGGVVVAAQELADEFLPNEQLIYYTSSFRGDKTEHLATKKGGFEKGKVVVLIDGVTASASEILVGALQDWDRALVLGQPSFGKGLIQQSYLLGDGSALRLTIGRYFTPMGRHLQKKEGLPYAVNDWIDQLPKNGHVNNVAFPDSLTINTKGRRRVFKGHGGIIPDIYLHNDTLANAYFNNASQAGILYDFATWYTHLNRQQLLRQFNKPADFRSNQAIDEAIKKAYLQYGNEVLKGKKTNFLISPVPDKIIQQLKAWVAAQLWSYEAFYMIRNDVDQWVNRAVRSLKDGSFEEIGVRR